MGLHFDDKLPQLLVILLTAAFFDGANFDLHAQLRVLLILELVFEFVDLVAYLVVLLAHQHLSNPLLIVLGMGHLPDLAAHLGQVLSQSRVGIKPVLEDSFGQAGQQLELFSKASHI